MDPKNPTPGENPATPPVATPPAPAGNPDPQSPPQNQPPSGSEPETNPGGQPGAMVPSDRLREETEKRRKAEEDFEEYKRTHPETPPAQPGTEDDDEIDPDVEKLLDRFAKKRGLVSQEELEGERIRLQVQSDVKDLETNPPVAGIPYDHSAVLAYANENGIPVTSKGALRAAYREMNNDKILEAERQRAIAGVQEGNRGGAEQPGSGGATPPSDPQVDGKTPSERNRSRIRSALQKHTS